MVTILRAKSIVCVLSLFHIMAVVKDSRYILIIDLGLLLKESTIDSIGHDL